MMPAWAVETAARKTAATWIRQQAGNLWAPDPAITLFTPRGGDDRVEICRNIVGTLLEHHPHAACLQLIGVSASPDLTWLLSGAGFVPASGGHGESISFRKPIDSLIGVGEIVLKASNWKTLKDFYHAFFRAVGAAEWHGRNPNAPEDSIAAGGINQIEVPYRILIENLSEAEPEVRAAMVRVIKLLSRLETEGCPGGRTRPMQYGRACWPWP